MLAADKISQFVYWATDGRLGERQLRYSMLLLHTIGRKTGKRRTHTLIYFRDGDNLVVCASNNGSPQLPAWYLNLQATPGVRIQYGRIQREVIAETVSPEGAERVWQMLLRLHPPRADYQKSSWRAVPMVLLKPLPAGR